MDDLLLKALASEHGTPLYVYDGDMIRQRYNTFKNAFETRYSPVKVSYAMKANSSLAVLKIFSSLGAGVDVVSGGELEVALKAGFSAKDILFTSNSKSPWEHELAVRKGAVINVDSVHEIQSLSKVAASLGKKAKVSFRVNPSVNPQTHPKIATGLKNAKFGVPIEDGVALEAYRQAKADSNLKVVGLHTHIGSQILETDSFRDAATRIMDFALQLKKELKIKLKFIDLGGGLGISYKGETNIIGPDDLAAAVVPVVEEGVKKLGYRPELWLEPGRWFVGPSGELIARVNSLKKTPDKKYANVNAGFNVLIRPAMYDSFHRVRVLGKLGEEETYDIAGNICESGDILAKDRKLPQIQEDDIICLMDAGAYGFAMASNYNSWPLPAEVLVEAGKGRLIRQRGTTKDLLRNQIA
ncbi:Diaminopimelate decarboxylase [uncultured archaeon]|nr:Diaminopimelate decarboxylase [uncultured archaeon]